MYTALCVSLTIDLCRAQPNLLVDDASALSTGELSSLLCFRVSRGAAASFPFRATLGTYSAAVVLVSVVDWMVYSAWSDYPGSPLSPLVPVNNLDLIVTLRGRTHHFHNTQQSD